MKSSINMYDGKVFGYKVSDYGLENGYLDYRTLSKMIGDMVLNNNIFLQAGYENWELFSGDEENEDGDYLEVYQYYIISDSGVKLLSEFTDELIFYNEELDMFLWGVTHWGTSWDYVLTDIELIERTDING